MERQNVGPLLTHEGNAGAGERQDCHCQQLHADLGFDWETVFRESLGILSVGREYWNEEASKDGGRLQQSVVEFDCFLVVE